MKKALTQLIFADCLFVLLLSLSSFLGNSLEWPLYAAAFVVPTLLLLGIEREEDLRIPVFSRSSVSVLSISLVFPIILIIFTMSFLTGLIMGAVGVEWVGNDLSGNIFFVIAVSAFAPAIFEEMLFRYIPLRLLGGYSKRLTVIYSAILFALAHGNAFQIPYAFVAGIMFMTIDIAMGSILPSVTIHFLNNILSIVWQRGGDSQTFVFVFLASLVLAALVSAIVICFNRKRFKDAFKPILTDKSKFIFTYQLGFYIIAMSLVAMSDFVI